MIIVRWSSRLLTSESRYKFIHSLPSTQYISPATDGSKLFIDNDKLITNIDNAVKYRKYMYYRLKTESSHIDAHISTVFMIRKNDGKICFRRLSEYRDDFDFILYDKDKKYFYLEKPLHFIRDSAYTRCFLINSFVSNLVKPTVIINGFVILL